MPMAAGKLRHFVTVQRQTGARDTTGAETDTWTTLFQAYASVEPWIGSSRSGREEFLRNQLQALDYTRITFRYNDVQGMNPKDRILFNGRYFDIQALNNRDERNELLEVVCKERQ